MTQDANKSPDSAAKGAVGKFSMAVLKENATKENAVMAAGATVAADGVRRAVQKDDEGERHIVRGIVQTAIGVGMFAAALVTQRKKINEQPPSPKR